MRINRDSQAFARGELIAKIRHIEAQQHRPTVELLLDPTNEAARKRLATLEAEKVALRKQLA